MDETLFLKCIIDENRRAIIRQLEGGKMSVGDIAESLKMEQSLCSHHLAKLRNCGLLDSEQSGKSVFYWISDDRILAFLDQLNDVSGFLGDLECD